MGGGAFGFKRTNGGLSITLHTDYYQRVFLSPGICSWAYIFHLLVLFTLIVLPFVLTFSSGEFWVKQAIYQEQPRVTFNHKVFGDLVFS